MSDRASGNGQGEGLPPPGTGRRRSLIILAVLLLGLPLAFVIRAATDEGWRGITTVAVLEERDVIYLPQIEVFLVHDDPPLALNALSPHLRDRIAFCAASETFVETGHGGLFDRHGLYLEGPPPRGMDRIAVRVRGGSVEINLERIEDGPPRGAEGTEEPTGPLCDPERAAEPQPGFLEPSGP